MLSAIILISGLMKRFRMKTIKPERGFIQAKRYHLGEEPVIYLMFALLVNLPAAFLSRCILTEHIVDLA